MLKDQPQAQKLPNQKAGQVRNPHKGGKANSVVLFVTYFFSIPNESFLPKPSLHTHIPI